MSARRLVPLVALCIAAGAAWFFLRANRVRPGNTVPPAAASAAPAKPPPAAAVGPFYVGVSSLDVGANERAGRLFDELAGKLPDEPAVWANLGLARLRLGDFPGAEAAFGTAARLAPQNSAVTVLLATLDEDQGRFAQAIERLRSLPDPDATVLYRLEELLGRTGREADPGPQLEIFDRLRQLQPNNPVVAFGRARLLARMENKPALLMAIDGLAAWRGDWPPAAQRQYASAQTAATAGNFRAAAAELTFLQNRNLATTAYQAGLAALGQADAFSGRPVREFLYYRRLAAIASAPDTALHFDVTPATSPSASPDFYLTLELDAAKGASVLSLAGGELHLGGAVKLPVGATLAGAGRSAFCAADLNGDFRQDLAVVGADGLKLWLQTGDGKFTAFRPSAELQQVFAQTGQGVWAFDYDADGDLDLFVARVGAAPQLLRNNGDGSFTAHDTFAALPEVREACWVDLDGDGVGDLAILDAAGRVLVAWNQRAGAFAAPQVVANGPAVALACGDIFGTGEMGLLVLERSGVIRSLVFDREQRIWANRELVRWSDAPDLADAFARRRTSLSVADLDNNGAPDLVAAGGTASAIWLNAGAGKFQRLAGAPAMFVTSIDDLDGDGFLDLVGLTSRGAAVAHTRGTKGYHWQSIRTHTLGAQGDSRINTFGIGGRIEVRAGPLLESAPIMSPSTHFGLGEQKQVGVARIVWPNGVAQMEFDPPPDQEVTAAQRLKGSCPWVFARAGGAFHFVKDFIWRSPLGMRINSQDTAGVDQTTDWILVPGKFLTPDHGAYEIRITAELWETHFFDQVALKVVDHPEGVAAFVDERFVPAHPPKLAIIATTPPQPFAEARDQSGRDVLRTLAATDGDCVNDFPLGRFQGVAQDHWIEFQLPATAPLDRPLVLVGEGWIYPTDSSLNVAISQSKEVAPHDLVLEDYDPQRGWRVASGDLGFPAGKNKTVVIPLPRESLAAGRRRFRLRTNLEVYWDRLGWAEALPGAPLQVTPAATLAAELRYRGFSKLGPPERREPDIPRHYDELSGPGPRWQDLEGYYTRYGDVRELLERIDDRYVIMNAGDEIVLRFAVPPAPPAGWTRDFVLAGDGWVKDGDFNTANSRTVQPLPYRAQKHYSDAPEALEDDPVFQQHRDDWRRFHTRYVTPAAFERGLMTGAAGIGGEGDSR